MYQPTPNYLPPNITPQSNTPKCHALIFQIVSTAYFQPVHPQPSLMRYKWWGLNKNNKIQQPLSQKQHIFYISVSVPMFLRYLRDMKILQIELCNSVGVGVARGCVNWMVLQQWKGQKQEIMVEFKSVKSNVVICQARISIRIQEISNPFYIYKHKDEINNNTELSNNKISQQTLVKTVIQQQQISRPNNRPQRPQPRPSINQNIINNEDYRGPLVPTYNFIDYGPQYNNPSSFGYEHLLSQNINQNANIAPIVTAPKPQIYLTEQQKKIQLFRKLNLPLPDNCICPEIEGNKFARQKLRLKEDIDLFFNNKASEFSASNTEQVIIQVTGWQALNRADQSLACRISVPVLQSKQNNQKVYQNQYNLTKPKGQQIHLKINTNLSQSAIKEYLSKNQLQIKVGDYYQGAVPLWKVIASKGDIVSIGVSDRRNKRDVLKGYLHLKLVITQKQVQKMEQNNNNSDIKKPIKQQQNNISPSVPTSMPVNNYMWVYVRQLHFLQPRYHEGSNIFLKLKPNKSLPNQDQHLQSKTVWNNVSPSFNQIFTINIGSSINKTDKITIEFRNRKQTERLVGKAQLSTSQLQNMLELPIDDNHGRTVAFIQLCVGKGDISNATQFINTHMKAFMRKPQREHHQQEQQIHQRSQKSERSHHSENDDHKQADSSLPNSSIQSQHQFQPTPLPSIPPQISHNDPDLSILQVHNKIFTAYVKGQHSWLQIYQNNLLTLAQFTQLVKPLLHSTKNNNNLMKFSSVYMQPVDSLIRLEQVRESYDSFQVYYKIMVEERDQVLSKFVEQLQQYGVSINQVQTQIDDKLIRVAPKNKLQLLWRAIKQYVSSHTAQKLRYFYEQSNIHQICDALRRYEVYQTTNGQQVPVNILSRQVNIEICQLLQIDPHSPNLKSAIKQAGVQLSKFEQLCIFGEINKKSSAHSGMVKSPTFGYLNTDRMPAPRFNQHYQNRAVVLSPQQIQDNHSLQLKLDNRQQSKLSGNISQKFGNPGVSPIHNQSHPKNNNNNKVHIQFMDTSGCVQQIAINSQVYNIDHLNLNNDQNSIELQVKKSFNYQGYVKVDNKGILEYQGVAGQWISLVGQDGQYCGCILIS